MNLSNLKPAVGSTKRTKRIARGTGSGHGGTSTRGHKGAKARSGFKSKRGHEGGQMPLQMRLPKGGFKNTHERYKTFNANLVTFNLSDLQSIADKYNISLISPDILRSLKIISKSDSIKVLGNGVLTRPLEISASDFSDTAKKLLSELGCKFYFVIKLSQIQGIAGLSKASEITPEIICNHIDYISANDKIHVVPEGSLSLNFNLFANKIDDQVIQLFSRKGNKCTVLS